MELPDRVVHIKKLTDVMMPKSLSVLMCLLFDMHWAVQWCDCHSLTLFSDKDGYAMLATLDLDMCVFWPGSDVATPNMAWLSNM